MIVEFTAAAEAELDEAIAYYNAQRTGLGIEFAQEVAASVKRIEDYPDVWQRMASGAANCGASNTASSIVCVEMWRQSTPLCICGGGPDIGATG